MIWRRRIKEMPLFQLQEAYQHILAVGRPGAGKTSFLTPVQKQLIQQGAYCLHCCVKPDEAWRAEQLMASVGKQATLFSPASGHIFNPLTFEMSRKGGSARSLAFFHEELAEVLTRSSSEQTETFWKAGATDLQIAAFELAFLVKGMDATYSDVLDIILSVPADLAQAASDAFRQTACGRFLEIALSKAPSKAMPIADLMLRRIPSVGDKARGAFVQAAVTSIQPLTIEPLCHAVNGKSTITPEQMMEGYTILDFDTLTYGLNGLALQLLVSWFVMEAVLRRKSWKRPLLLVRDEYHQLCHARRCVQAMSLGRSQGLAALSAFQSIPVLEDALGAGIEAQTQAKALVGLHVNRIWCNNNCHISNEFASMSIGQERKMFFGGSTPNPSQPAEWFDVLGVGQRPSFSFNQQYHFLVEPRQFTGLRTGGEPNQYIVDGIVTKGRHDYQLVSISQR